MNKTSGFRFRIGPARRTGASPVPSGPKNSPRLTLAPPLPPRERQARVHSPKGRRLRSRPCPMRGEAEGSDAGVAQEAARRRATRRVSLAAHVSVRGMAEAGRLTVGGRVARLRAYGLGDTRGASGASPKSPLRFRRRPDLNLSQRFAGDLNGIWASHPENPG